MACFMRRKSMEPNKFRNHFSMVLEQIWSVIFILLIFLVNQGSEIIDKVREAYKSHGVTQDFWVLALILAVIILVVVYNVMIWAKTYITIEAHAIVIEKNTLSKHIDTIGIANISNVNLQQNVFERLMGTCKVKLDTNTLSTANETDLTLILKKEKAEWFKAQIMQGLQENQSKCNAPIDSVESMEESSSYQFKAGTKEVLTNSICHLSWVNVTIFIGGFAVGSANMIETIGKWFQFENVMDLLIHLLFALILVGMALWSIVKSFFVYYGFRIERKKNKIYLKYGFFKQVEYTIPVDKINAVTIKQTFMGRLLRRYTVEVVNVGASDEADEGGNCLILASSKEEMLERLSMLLPEYQKMPIDQIEYQPRVTLLVKGIRNLIGAIVVGCITAIVVNVFMEVPKEAASLLQVIACIGLLVWTILVTVLNYWTNGIYKDEKYLIIANGLFGRKVDIIQYDKIQYLKIKSSALSRHYKLAKGQLFLLAGIGNQVKSLPYQPIEKFESIAVSMIGQ